MLLEGYGQRLQCSVFRRRLTPRDEERRRWELTKVTTADDDWLILPVCDACADRARRHDDRSGWPAEPPGYRVFDGRYAGDSRTGAWRTRPPYRAAPARCSPPRSVKMAPKLSSHQRVRCWNLRCRKALSTSSRRGRSTPLVEVSESLMPQGVEQPHIEAEATLVAVTCWDL